MMNPTNQTIKETLASTVKFLPTISPLGEQSIITAQPGYRKYSAPLSSVQGRTQERWVVWWAVISAALQNCKK